MNPPHFIVRRRAAFASSPSLMLLLAHLSVPTVSALDISTPYNGNVTLATNFDSIFVYNNGNIFGGYQKFGATGTRLLASKANSVTGGHQFFEGAGSGMNISVPNAVTGGLQEYFTGGLAVQADKTSGISGGTTYVRGTSRIDVTVNQGITGSTAVITENTGEIRMTNGSGMTVSSLSGTGGAISAVAASTLTINQGDGAATYGGQINSAISVLKTGPGTQGLTGNNIFSGTLTVEGGLIAFNGGSNLGSGAANVVLNGGGLKWNTGNTLDISARLQSLGTAGGTFDTNGNNVAFANPLAGSGAVTKDGSGSLTFSTANTYAGGTIVKAGSLVLAGAGGGTGVIRGELTINGGAVEAQVANALGYENGLKVSSVTVRNGAAFNSPAAQDQGWGIAWRLEGGTISSNNGTSNSSTPSKFAFGNYTSVSVGAGQSFIKGRVDLRGDFNPTTDITVEDGGELHLSAAITSTNGATGFKKLGNGSLFLSGANTYTGTLVLDRGLTSVSNAACLSSPTSTIMFDGGVLGVSADMPDLGSHSVNFSTFNGGISNTATFTLGQALSGSGFFSKAGSGLLRMTNINAHTNGTRVFGGRLELAAASNGVGTVRGDLLISGNATVELTAPNALGYVTGQKVNSVTINSGTLRNYTQDDQGWGIAYTLNSGDLVSNDLTASASTPSKFAFGNGTSVKALEGSTNSISGRVDLRGDGGQTTTHFDIEANAVLNVTAAVTSGGGITGLTKIGAGIMTLSGPNTYTGTTEVNDGTLRLTSPFLTNGSTLKIATGAIVELQHSQTDQIANLIVGGVSYLDGLYGPVGSADPTDIELPALTGSGYLRVVTGMTPWQLWLASHHLTGDEAEPTADPDGDGDSNRVEFAFGGDPNAGSPSPQFVTWSDVDNDGSRELVLTLPVRVGAVFVSDGPALKTTVDGVVCRVEGGATLDDFTTPVVEISPTGTAGTPPGGYEFRSFRLDAPPSGRGFLRAIASAP